MIVLKVALKLDPGIEMTKHGGAYPGPLTEIEVNIYIQEGGVNCCIQSLEKWK